MVLPPLGTFLGEGHTWQYSWFCILGSLLGQCPVCRAYTRFGTKISNVQGQYTIPVLSLLPIFFILVWTLCIWCLVGEVPPRIFLKLTQFGFKAWINNHLAWWLPFPCMCLVKIYHSLLWSFLFFNSFVMKMLIAQLFPLPSISLSLILDSFIKTNF